MNRSENIAYLKFHKIGPDSLILSHQLKVDCTANKVVSKTPLVVDYNSLLYKIGDQTCSRDSKPRFISFNSADNFNDSSIRVIKLGGVEDLNPLNFSADVTASNANDTNEAHNGRNIVSNALIPKRESKVPNIPMMIRCQNCDTNFPTKYQFQRHQCEFNAEKVVLKPNIDAKEVDKGVRMKFDCPSCGKQFVSKNNLERHLTSHDEDNVNICEYCNKQFVSENRLRIHKENHCKKAGDISKFYRSDVTVWKCLKCFQVFSSDVFASAHADNCQENLESVEKLEQKPLDSEHESGNGNKYVEKVMTELLLQCEFCNKTYADKSSLLMHQDTHTTEVNFSCVICNETFESYTFAAKHWLTKCSNEASLFYLPKLTYCQFCDKTFKSHEVLYSHKIKKKHYSPKKYYSSGSTSDVSTTKTSNDEFTEEPKKEENKETIIKLIEDVLCSIKLNLNNDTKLKEPEDADKENEVVTVKSEVSDDLVISEDPLLDDSSAGNRKKRGRKRKLIGESGKNKRIAGNVEPGYKYQCERCVKVFDCVFDLETHRNKEHPANYKCEECDQVVHSSKALLIHTRAHQSLKPHVCEICKRCYSQTSHLWQHMRFHQGIKPFACPHEGCEARYTIRPDLKDHIRKVHTRERPFKCSVCDKCFLTGSVYYQHRLIHTNDRRYACDICNKRFFRADALNNHRRIHTDERPYPCNVCGRHFRQKGDRNKHVRTQHPDAHV